MNIDDFIAVGRNDLFAQHAQKACQHDHINVMGLQNAQQGSIKGSAVCILLAADNSALHAEIGGPFQRVYAGLAGDDQRDFSVRVFAAALTFQQGLQVGAAARYQYRYTLHTSSTPSPSTMVPRR